MKLSFLSIRSARPPWGAFAIIGFLAAILGPEGGHAQAVTARNVPFDPICSRCTITSHSTINLQLPNDTSDQFPIRVRIDSKGRYWVFRRQNLALVFDHEGRLIQELGPRGLGLGEYLTPYDAAIVPPDSVLVFDALAERATLLGPGLAPARYIGMPVALSSPLILSWPDFLVASANISTPASAGWPLHTVKVAAGAFVVSNSFGSGDGTLVPHSAPGGRVLLGISQRPGFWSAGAYGDIVAQWSLRADVLREFRIKHPDGQIRVASTQRNWRSEPPPPVTVSVAEDHRGLLWRLVLIPRPDWQDAYSAVPLNLSEAPASIVKVHVLFRTMIEVLDPSRSRVVARQIVDDYAINMLPGNRVALIRAIKENPTSLSISRLNLVGW